MKWKESLRSAIKSLISGNAALQLTVLPVKTNITNLSFSIFESSTNSGNLPEGLQRVIDLNVDLGSWAVQTGLEFHYGANHGVQVLADAKSS